MGEILNIKQNFADKYGTGDVYLSLYSGDPTRTDKITPTVAERHDNGWELLQWDLGGFLQITQIGLGVHDSISVLEIAKVETVTLDGTVLELRPDRTSEHHAARILEDGCDSLFLLKNHSPVVRFFCGRRVRSIMARLRVLAHGSSCRQFERLMLRRDLELARNDLRGERQKAGELYRTAIRALGKISRMEREITQIKEERNVLAADRAALERRLLELELSAKNENRTHTPGAPILRRVKPYLQRARGANGSKQLDSIAHSGEQLISSNNSPAKDYAIYLRRLVADSGLFDPTAYRAHYADVAESNADPFEHFLSHGLAELRRPGPNFDPIFYLQNNPDVRGRNPLIHFLEFGRREGRPGIHPAMSAQMPPRVREELYFSSSDAGHRGSFYSALSFATQYRKVPTRPLYPSFNPLSLDIHWVIPDFLPGMGGHMTIFRMVRFLEEMGHKQTVWLRSPARRRAPEQVQAEIMEHFQPTSPSVGFLEDRHPSTMMGDVVIATDRWTAYPVAAMERFKARFYFVQDYEPFFYPIGSEFYLAEQTYRLGLDCLVCSRWLEEKMRGFGNWTGRCHLAFDHETYFSQANLPNCSNSVPRIAFYARYATSRRCVELGMLALELLRRQGVRFEVDFFGSEFLEIEVDYPYVNHGILNHGQLAELYRRATMGIVFSATNYSLIPNEMMACGLPVLELDVESNRSEYPTGCIELVEPEPIAISNAVASLLRDPEKRASLARAGLQWTAQLSWSQSAKELESAIRTRLTAIQGDLNTAGQYLARYNRASMATNPTASIIIPTFNGGDIFKRVLDAISRQQTPWDYEVIIIDSGSRDDTVEISREFAKVFASTILYAIKNEDFGHGCTRNLGAQLSRGDFLVFLTQDALPADELWLYELVDAVAKDSSIAGAFGRHVAYDSADPFTKRDLEEHFAGLKAFPLCNRNLDHHRYLIGDISWRQVLHYFSDNSSCLRRSAWERYPYPDIEFGEDQAWAAIIIENGLSKAYAYDSIVYHSHDYDEAETEARAYTESVFFREMFGYLLCKNEAEFERNLKYLNDRDCRYAEENGISSSLLENRLRLNRARMLGTLRGTTAGTMKPELRKLGKVMAGTTFEIEALSGAA